jgi:hypothetical protein
MSDARYTRTENRVRLEMTVTYNRYYKFVTVSLLKRPRNAILTSQTATVGASTKI